MLSDFRLPSKEDFKAYEQVRASGRFNMFHPQARTATGLSREKFIEILSHYEELMERYPEVRKGD